MLSGLRSSIGGLREELRALRHDYPAFVTRDVHGLPVGEVPVFTFHTIEPEPFEAQLRHLTRNGYCTIDTDTLWRHLTGEAPAPPNAVLLTIDDGRKSVWTHGFPLLRRHGCKATVFLIPGYVPEGAGVAATLEDVWAGRLAPEALESRDPELMNWHEIRAMHQAGVIDFQSHTRFHHRVPVASTLVGFLAPDNRDALFDLPVPAGFEPVLAAGSAAACLGLPLFASATLMHVRPRYHPEPRVLEACMARVRDAGGAAFFAAPRAIETLQQTYAEAVAEHGPGHLDSPAEVAAAVLDDLVQSRLAIDAALDGAVCRHLCYPYTEGSPQAVQLSREAGFCSNFWGLKRGRSSNRQGDDPFHIPRLKGDYVERLPGQGRRSLGAILAAKVRRRIAGGPIY